MQPQHSFNYIKTINAVSALVIPLLLTIIAFRSLMVFGPTTILNPVALDTWLPYRNMAYIYYIALILALSVYVAMNRKMEKSAASVLNKLVLGILLTTFSFVFAGILYDFYYVIMYSMK